LDIAALSVGQVKVGDFCSGRQSVAVAAAGGGLGHPAMVVDAAPYSGREFLRTGLFGFA
jgi:hypothetical protein